MVVEAAMDKNELRFLTPTQTVVEGSTCEGMIVCGATRILGRLQGFLVDPVAQRLRYLVVQATGLLSRPRLIPVTEARIDVGAHAIQLLNQDDIQTGEPFKRDRFAAYAESDLVAT